MTRTRAAFALAAVLLAVTAAPGDDTPAAKFLGRWALPGKAKQRWEFHADGTVTATADGKPVFHPTGSPGPHLSYSVGGTDEEGNVELTLTLRGDQSEAQGVYQAKVEFTRQGRWAVKYVQKPADVDRFPPPFPEGKKLYRPEDVTD